MLDLFGQKHDEPDEYKTYMASAKWATKRAQKLEQAGHKCEACGQSKYSGPLDVHHLTYDRLGHERLDDLQVLCKACHDGADEKRKEDERAAKPKSALYSGFMKWVKKGNLSTRYWPLVPAFTAGQLKKEYLRYMKRVTGKSYCIDLRLLDKFDPDPEWKP